jgi:hypothetical protein
VAGKATCNEQAARPDTIQLARPQPQPRTDMNLIQRVQDILLKPKETWPQIAQETASTASIYNPYVLALAAIPAVAGFIGMSLLGMGGFGFSMRVPVASGLVNMVAGYAMTLAIVWVMAWVVNSLAPTFGGSRDAVAALKVVAYASTAAFVGGVANLVPMLGILALLAAIYSIYLLYLGLPALMKCPPGKAGAYTAVVVVCGIVITVVLGSIWARMMPGPGMHMGGGAMGGAEIAIKTPQGEVKVDGNRLEDMARKMEEAGKRMEAAQKSGDSAAAGKAMGDIVGAMAGAAGGSLPVSAQELKALLPEKVGALPRTSYEAEGGQAMGFSASTAKGKYSAGDQQLELSIMDMGGMAGLAALAGWANVTVDRDSDGKIEKVYKQGERTVREEYQKDGSRTEMTVILKNGVMVEAHGDKVDRAMVQKAIESLDLAKLETLKRPTKP